MRTKAKKTLKGMIRLSEGGFTLIEMSIVLVIIGLIVGGVLVGQDLIRAAYVRATISQIEKYNMEVNTFYGKYQALPGDMNASTANMYGFAARGAGPGQGDGNGVIEGTLFGGHGTLVFGGETEMFWVDLSHAGLIDGGFVQNNMLGAPASVSLTQVAMYMPEAKLGGGNYIYVWSGGWLGFSGISITGDGINYFGLSAIMGSPGVGNPVSNTTLTVQQAYSVDRKLDDGWPQSGRVTAMYDGRHVFWAAGGPSDALGETISGASDPTTKGPVFAGDGVATPGTITTCYDNGKHPGRHRAIFY